MTVNFARIARTAGLPFVPYALAFLAACDGHNTHHSDTDRGAPSAGEGERRGGGTRSPSPAAIGDRIRHLVTSRRVGLQTAPEPPAAARTNADTSAADMLSRLYGPREWTPLWLNADARPSTAAAAALAAIDGARDDGIDPDRYALRRLRTLADSMQKGASLPLDSIAEFDAALSAATLQLMVDLHYGRIDPASVGFNLRARKTAGDIPAIAARAIASGGIQAALDSLRPQFVLYRYGREALHRYRALADAHAGGMPFPMPEKSIHPGDPLAWAPALPARLALLGDLGNDEMAGATYSGDLVQAVRHFQERHGLDGDGVLGRATVAELNVPISQRVDQLALSLERLRWLPDPDKGRLIVVNIPSFHLWAWDSLANEATPAFSMKVVVGDETETKRTPVFADAVRYVVFRPYWNVPSSITRREILPAVKKDHGYLASNDMEIVRDDGNDATAVPTTPENLQLVAQEKLRIRQRPGPKNPLGLVKFIFPNADNVYLHGTSAQEPFGRSLRALSHGCIRVERPVDLAAFVLAPDSAWDRDRIVAAMNGEEPGRVNLKVPVPVLLFYTTALVTPDGTVGFYRDIYGYDPALERALASDSAAPRELVRAR